jgi:DNA-binding response OmpR family regulator
VIDPDLHLARALLIEGNPLLRSITSAQLKDAGVGHVVQRSRVRDARLLLESEVFDIVICNLEFEGSDYSGQDLLDELRREQMLPHGTVFLMVTNEATYSKVVEAAEAALDGFIVRPFTAATLLDRLLEARQRKRVLADIHRALASGELEQAFARALKRFQERAPYAAYCGRLASELLLRLGRPDDALKLFHRIDETASSPWAALGCVRAELAAGRLGAARKALERLLARDPMNADALDLKGRLCAEGSDFPGALEAYRAAAALTPGCMLRAQHAGALAFYLGEEKEAATLLQRARSMGTQSRLFDALSLYLLALIHFDRRDREALREVAVQLRQLDNRHVSSKRLERLHAACTALQAHCSNPDNTTEAIDAMRVLSQAVDEEDFDIEAAQVILTLWPRMPTATHRDAELGQLAQRIALRFCTSKAIADLFIAAGRGHAVVTDAVRQSQARIQTISEQAVDTAMQGHASDAITELLEKGRLTRNAKLLEMAAVMVRRHAQALEPGRSESLLGEIDAECRRLSPGVSHIAGLLRSSRSPGGLSLRR